MPSSELAIPANALLNDEASVLENLRPWRQRGSFQQRARRPWCNNAMPRGRGGRQISSSTRQGSSLACKGAGGRTEATATSNFNGGGAACWSYRTMTMHTQATGSGLIGTIRFSLLCSIQIALNCVKGSSELNLHCERQNLLDLSHEIRETFEFICCFYCF